MKYKFRLWNDITKKWMLGYEYPNLGGFFMLGECMMFGQYTDALNSVSLEDLNKLKLSLFSGLKDKNGKEIYEGDKIKYKNHNGYSKVVFENGAFGYYGLSCFVTLLDTNMGYVEIIGNMFENPELKI